MPVPKTDALPLGYTPENAASGKEGIEPPLLGLESNVLPLHHFPIKVEKNKFTLRCKGRGNRTPLSKFEA
jgi:hypothetical protein